MVNMSIFSQQDNANSIIRAYRTLTEVIYPNIKHISRQTECTHISHL